MQESPRAAEAEPGQIGVFGSATGPEEVEALAPSVLTGWMGMGPKVREFEEAFATRLGSSFVMTDSGSNALQLAVAALGLPPGSDVVVPSFTWVACANAVALCGHRPVFADVDLATCNVQRGTIERALTKRTRAVMVVHYAGNPAELRPILELGLPVIEDAAHAVDSTIDGSPCGTLGSVGVYSFDGVKNVATPGGGGISSTDERLLERARTLRYCGIGGSGVERSKAGGRWWEQTTVAPFPRAIPNDVSASVGLVQLDRLATSQARRLEVWRRYREELADARFLVLPPDPRPGTRHSYFTFFVRVTDGRRDELAHELLRRGIYTTLRYQPLHLVWPAERRPRLPSCELLNQQGLNLPLHPRLTDGDVSRVIEAIRDF